MRRRPPSDTMAAVRDAGKIIERVRLAAVREAADDLVGADALIQLGLDALTAGIDSPSLPLLAGLTRAEEPDARVLFHRVADELGLAVDLPEDPAARRRALVLWWARFVVDGVLDPAEGAHRICREADGPRESLATLEDLLVSYEDRSTSATAPEGELQALADRIVAEAAVLLSAEPCPPR